MLRSTPECSWTSSASRPAPEPDLRLASHTGAAVIPGFALWSESEKKFVLRFYPEVPISGNVQADSACIHAVLERVIREYPDQWLWIHRRWKTRPPEELRPPA